MEQAREGLRVWRITRVSVSVSVRISLYEIFCRANFNNFGVKVVTLSDSAFSNVVSSKLVFSTHLGLSWDDNNFKYTLLLKEKFLGNSQNWTF